MSVLIKEDYANPQIPLWASRSSNYAIKPIEVFQGQILNINVSNSGYVNIMPSNTFTLPPNTTKIRMTVAINCFSGLGNNEHLQVYLGFTDGIIAPKGDIYSSSTPFSKGTEPLGGMVYSATMTIVDSMDGLNPSAFPEDYSFQVFAKTVTGSHTCNFNVYITLDIL